ncbi:ketopantoate reductase family protein [Bacillus sp. AFS017336]|uniref:ketopantoate reductase family protein n=1 Tax=Bacillus sp. AFS017336 TaxID=2033489 RepID=UPI000BEFA4D3|nr:2-dehydropantoate 2-reductase N-terminal domain-containing protein [Bacillus sp. AFS017336]PEL07588.1 2-dehydropantoate 2-reductase [Bacillus sp. AFS017336]
MKILIYGAGVLGSYLAHALVRAGNEVTVLARGRRYEQLKKDGIVIRHHFQRKNTVDSVNVINRLEQDDYYDLIFVVMKYNQFTSVLPILAQNNSNNIIIVGNNADSANMQNFLVENSEVKKNIVFGFQLSGGKREESGRIISVRGGGQMVIGSLDGDISFKSTLENAFKQSKYKLIYNDNIDGWLKSHVIAIVAMNSIHYLNNFDFKKISKNKIALTQMISAMDEGFMILEKLGYKIDPAFQVKVVRNYRKIGYYGMKIFHKLSVNKLIEGSFSEIEAVYRTFDELQKEANISTPVWEDLKKRSLEKYRDEAI